MFGAMHFIYYINRSIVTKLPNSSNLINTALLMSFSPLFYVNSVFCMCVVCLLSFVDFNKIFYPKKSRINLFVLLTNSTQRIIMSCGERWARTSDN